MPWKKLSVRYVFKSRAIMNGLIVICKSPGPNSALFLLKLQIKKSSSARFFSQPVRMLFCLKGQRKVLIICYVK